MADKRVIVYDTTLNVPDELTAADRASFPGGFVNAGAAGDMGSQKLTGLADATAAGDALAHTQTGAVLDGLNLNAAKLTNLIAGTVPTDGVTKAQLDAVAAGAEAKPAVKVATLAALPAYTQAGSGVGATLTANAVGILTVDGVATVLGNRILVKDEAASHIDHGIYEVTTEGTAGVAFVLTRSTDFDGNPAGEVKNGSYTFVQEGTQAFTGWMLVTPDPITVDTTALDFDQFQGFTAFVFGAGLLDTANTISVELDAAADAQGVGTGGGSSGLEFDAVGDGGQLRVKVDPAQGIQRLAAGIGLELDGTTLQTAAAGVSVLGLPTAFEVNGVATDGANLTAANLDILVDGSNADALHVHAGAVATEAPKVENTYNAAAAISVGDPVHFGANNEVAPSDAATLTGAASHVFGVARTSGAIGNPIEVVSNGPCTAVLTGAGFGDDYFLENGTGLTNTAPSGTGKRRLWKVGYAINATDLFVAPMDLGIRTIA